MKKVLIAAVALMMGASLSLAGMGVTWDAGGGWLVAYGETVDGAGVLQDNNVIWQLIYSADDVANAPNLAAAPYLAGDDELLASREIPAAGSGGTSTASDGTAWDEWLTFQSGDTAYQDLSWDRAGYVYQRIWQGTPSVEDGGYYFETTPVAIDTAYATGSATQELYYDAAGNGVAVDNYIPGEGPGPQPQVPEPATMSLLGLGALAMVLRRKLSK